MTYSVNLFADELTDYLIDEAGFNRSQCKMSIYYKYAPDGYKLVVLSYVDCCIYWYTYKEILKLFVNTLEKIFHVNFLGYSLCFMYIRIPKLKDNYISVDKARYATYVVQKYLDNITIKNPKFHDTNLPHDMIITKKYASTSDEQVGVISRDHNLRYRAFVLSLIYILSTRVDLYFPIYRLAKFSSNTGKVHFEGLVQLLR